MRNNFSKWGLIIALIGCISVIAIEAFDIADILDQDKEVVCENVILDTLNVYHFDTQFVELPVIEWRDWIDTFYQSKTDSVFFLDTIVEYIERKTKKAKNPNFYSDSIQYDHGELQYAILVDGTLEGFFDKMTFYPQQKEVRRKKWGYDIGMGIMKTPEQSKGFGEVGIRYNRFRVGVWTDFELNNVGVVTGLSW